MIGAIFGTASIVGSIVGLLAAAKGAAKTQSILRQGNQHDGMIDIMAWVDRHVLRSADVVAGNRR